MVNKKAAGDVGGEWAALRAQALNRAVLRWRTRGCARLEPLVHCGGIVNCACD